MQNNFQHVKIVLVGSYNSGKTTYNSFHSIVSLHQRELKHQFTSQFNFNIILTVKQAVNSLY